MNHIEIYTTAICPYCLRAKALLNAKGISYQEYDVSRDTEKLSEMLERSQRKTVPQIFIGDHHIGGSDELIAAENNGQLDELLEAHASIPAA